MGRLIAGGDSYVWGSEMADGNNEQFSKFTWPALLADYLQAEYNCVAYYGDSNTAIARRVMNHCQKFKHDIALVVVQWTFGDRFEFRMRYDTNQFDSPWYSISPWTVETEMSNLAKTFQNENQEIFDYHVKHIQKAQQLGIADFANHFYQHVGNSEYYEIYISLREIVFLQNYLKLNNIPFLFTASNSILFDPDVFTFKTADDNIKVLLDQVDWSSWYKFPGEKHPSGFYRWARENNYRMGTTHPLEEAHQGAFDLIKERFAHG